MAHWLAQLSIVTAARNNVGGEMQEDARRRRPADELGRHRQEDPMGLSRRRQRSRGGGGGEREFGMLDQRRALDGWMSELNELLKMRPIR